MTGKSWYGVLSMQNLLLYAPLLHCYVEHGAVIKAIYCQINYQAKKIYTWFVEQVKEAHYTEEQSSVSRGIQTARQQWLWKTH